MKHTLSRTPLAVILFATFCLSLAPAMRAEEEGHCSNDSVAGKWGYSYTGSLILPTGAVTVASVGRFTLDAEGNLSGTQTRSNDGSTAVETITATLTVNADCTGTGNFNVYDSGRLVRSAVLAFVFVDGSKEFRVIFESLTPTGGPSLPVVITANGKKL